MTHERACTSQPTYLLILICCGITCLVSACLAPASGDNDDDDSCSPSCSVGYVCRSGSCVEASGTGQCSPACSVGYVCQQGTCVQGSGAGTGDTPPPSAIGAACAGNSDCSANLCLSDTGIPDGYCSKLCATGAAGVDDTCPAGSACLQTSTSSSACLDVCVTTADCRAGYACKDAGTARVCLPGCTSDVECALDEACNLSTGICETNSSGVSRLGGACSSEADCTTELCATETDSGWPGGVCLGDCSGRSTGDFCDGATPSSGLCVEYNTQTAICFQSCTTGNDCRSGYFCSADVGASNDQGYGFCLARCESTGCEAGEYCDASGVCEEGNAVMDQTVERLALGSVPITSNSETAMGTLDVPADAISFSLSLSSDSSSGSPALSKLVSPSGETVFDYFNPIDSDIKYSPSFYNPSGFLYPNAPALNLTPGTYTFEFGATGPATVAVEAFIKRGSPPQGGRLPLNLWFTANSYFTAASAQNDPDFQQVITNVETIYARAGIEIAPITYNDVAEPAASRYGVSDIITDGVGEISSAIVGGRPIEGANLIFHEQLLVDGSPTLYGVSAGLPGPIGRQDTQTLGVLVALEIHFPGGQIDIPELSATMAHELGHYLGLFHLSERDGSSHDPLSDTEECPASRDSDGDGILSAGECSGTGPNNLMFWTTGAAYGYTTDQLSDQQIWVLNRSTMVTP